jgi:RES domain-containing protein
MLIYRLHRAVRAAGDYAGALLAGGRWNPPGTAILYTAQHLSLACVEILVHVDKVQLPPEYVWSKTRLPNTPAVLETGNVRELTACQMAGQSWAETANELAVCVRSVVIPEEFNVLLNPKHRDYGQLVWSNSRPFHFDPRLFTFEHPPE